jgi:ABC-type branched-subunit amino acid transport system substrate-binding protein
VPARRPPGSEPARIGLITDQTGALCFMGIANVNVAKMVTDDINARGGLLGRPVELYVEDSATEQRPYVDRPLVPPG